MRWHGLRSSRHTGIADSACELHGVGCSFRFAPFKGGMADPQTALLELYRSLDRENPGCPSLRASSEHLLPHILHPWQGDQGVPTAAVQRGPALLSILVSLKCGAVGRFLLRPSSEHILIVRAPGAGESPNCPATASEAARCGSTGTPWLPCTFFYSYLNPSTTGCLAAHRAGR